MGRDTPSIRADNGDALALGSGIRIYWTAGESYKPCSESQGSVCGVTGPGRSPGRGR
jgi:hypothetical protein